MGTPSGIHPFRGRQRNFPDWYFYKSDQERAQNLDRSIFEHHVDEYFEVTMKLDGSSISRFNTGDEVGAGLQSLVEG